jgi:chorismate synthase
MILEGMPAGLPIDFDAITAQLRRRQGGYGRGRRMAIESDRAQALSGIRHGVTTGSPIALVIPNKDWENWQRTMSIEAAPPTDTPGVDRPVVTRPRPGHADLAGIAKYGHEDIRNVLERASARETASRVALGAIARQLLHQLETEIVSHVVSIGAASIPDALAVTFEDVENIPADSALHCVDRGVEQRMIAEIDAAREAGDTMGGSFEVIARGVPVGLGSHVQWDRKLDGRLAQALMSIPAIKGVGIGRGPAVASLPGSRIHDEILPVAVSNPAKAGSHAPPAVDSDFSRIARSSELPVVRPTNNAGGLEGGITNGQDLRITGYMKPIATLMKPLRSIDINTLELSPAAIERSDVCAVPAAAVVGEAMVAIILAEAALEKFGGDSLGEILANWHAARARTSARFTQR